MKTVLLLVVLGLVLYSSTLFAGEYLMNDTGDTAYALRVVFFEPVRITAFGDELISVEPSSEASEFVFSDGEVLAWAGHWLNWEPASTALVSHEWLTEVPVGTGDITVVSQPEIATVFEVGLVPSSPSSTMRQGLIDDFESPDLKSRFGGTYAWGAASKTSRDTHCEIAWTAQGPYGGHVSFTYEYRSWLKVGLWGFQEPVDASEYDGIEVTLWSDEPCVVEAEIGAWNEQNKWIAYLSESLQVDTIPRTFRVPFADFSPYNSSSSGVPGAHLARVNAISFFPRNKAGTLHLDNLAFYGEDPTTQDLATGFETPLTGTITRYVSNERVPFWIRYECDFPGASKLAFQWEVDSGIEEEYEVARSDILTSQAASPRFLLLSNAETTDVRLQITDSDGLQYEWQDLAVDIPLHNSTEITLDATQFVPEGEIASVVWTAANGDPADAKTFPIADSTSFVTTLVSKWPNALNIDCDIERQDGSVLRRGIEALIYFRDGTPFEIRGTGATVYGPDISTYKLADMLTTMFGDLKGWGFNAITAQVIWWYGRPDGQGTFRIHPIYWADYDTRDPRGATITPDQLETFLSIANEERFSIDVQMRQYPYWNDPTLSQEWGGWGPHMGFKWSSSWLYGKDGYKKMLLQYLPVFVKYNAASVFLGAENGDVEAHGGAATREFYQNMISAYRAGGFQEALGYSTAYFHNPDYPEMPPLYLENLDPARCGIPWSDMDYIGLTFYPKLANTFDAETGVMYEEALRQIDKYLLPLHETYGKPLYIEECYCDGYDGCAIRPVDNRWRLSKSCDLEEQRRWQTALLRAFTHTNLLAQSPWVKGLNMFCYSLDPWLGGVPFGDRVMSATLNNAVKEHEHLRRLACVFFRDVPLHVDE